MSEEIPEPGCKVPQWPERQHRGPKNPELAPLERLPCRRPSKPDRSVVPSQCGQHGWCPYCSGREEASIWVVHFHAVETTTVVLMRTSRGAASRDRSLTIGEPAHCE